MSALLAEEEAMPKPRGRTFLERKASHFLTTEHNPHGQRTRGWSIMAPRGGKQREELYNKCGSKCFLGKITRGPKGGFKAGFPICARCVEGKCDCRPVAGGIVAARVRARQWGYPEVAKRAEQLKQEYHIPKEVPPRRSLRSRKK